MELSDDEDDADLVGRDDDDTAGDASDPDFLKEYPDTTDVRQAPLRLLDMLYQQLTVVTLHNAVRTYTCST